MIAMHLIGVVAGVGMLRTKRWALWVATGLGMLNLGFVALVLTGVVDVFEGFYQDPLLRAMVFSILGAMFTVWAGFCMMILVARSTTGSGNER